MDGFFVVFPQDFGQLLGVPKCPRGQNGEGFLLGRGGVVGVQTHKIEVKGLKGDQLLQISTGLDQPIEVMFDEVLIQFTAVEVTQHTLPTDRGGRSPDSGCVWKDFADVLCKRKPWVRNRSTNSSRFWRLSAVSIRNMNFSSFRTYVGSRLMTWAQETQ